jgi:porin
VPAPEASSDAPVPAQAPPKEQPASQKPDAHVHALGQPSDRCAKEVLKDIWTRDKLSGDWGGLRTHLAEHGVYPEIKFSQFGQGVATGGRDTNGEYGGLVDWWLNVDASKLAGLWEGLVISLHAQTRYGKDISVDAGAFVLPNTPLLYPLPGDYDGTEITGLFLQQAFFDGQVDVLFGKLNVIDLWTAFYPNVGYGLEGFQNVNALASAWPFLRFVNLSMWGGGLWKNKPEKGIEGGFLFFGQENVTTTWDFSDSFEDGVGLLGFWRFFWDIGELPGSLLLVGLGSTKKYGVLEPTVWQVGLDPFTDLILPGAEVERNRPWGAAAYLYQEFWHASGDKGRKAYVYMGGSAADDKSSFARWNLFASLEAIGLLPMRPADRMGFAGWYNRLNDSLKQEVRIASLGSVRPRDASWGFELYYNLEINSWLHVTADLQLAQNADKDDDFAVIPGGRLVIEF